MTITVGKAYGNINKNYEGLGTTEKRGDTGGTIILFINPLIFDTKIPRD